jgi:hypothetical protein
MRKGPGRNAGPSLCPGTRPAGPRTAAEWRGNSSTEVPPRFRAQTRPIAVHSRPRGAIAQLEERLHGMQPPLSGQVSSAGRGVSASDSGSVIGSHRVRIETRCQGRRWPILCWAYVPNPAVSVCLRACELKDHARVGSSVPWNMQWSMRCCSSLARVSNGAICPPNTRRAAAVAYMFALMRAEPA